MLNVHAQGCCKPGLNPPFFYRGGLLLLLRITHGAQVYLPEESPRECRDAHSKVRHAVRECEYQHCFLWLGASALLDPPIILTPCLLPS